MKVAKALTDAEVKALRKTGTTAVGGAIGLYLLIKKDGHRYWVFRHRNADGRLTNFSLGNADRIPLSRARKQAVEYADRLAEGIYPKQVRDASRARSRADVERRRLEKMEAENTFSRVSERYVAEMEASGFWSQNPKGEQGVIAKLRIHILPVIGSKPITSLTAQDVYQVVAPIYQTRPATSNKLLFLIADIWRFAKARGLITHRDENPADRKGSLGILLRPLRIRQQSRHYAALSPDDIPAFMTDLKAKGGIAARCLEFAILTALRSKMARYARWRDIDFKAKTLTIHEESLKTKGRGAHTAFLSDEALAVLDCVTPINGCDYIFASPHTLEPFSDAALGKVIKDLHEAKFASDGIGWIDREASAREGRPVVATAHGTARATFKTWARTGENRKRLDDEAVELCLAHKLKDDYAGAYNRATLEDERREVMSAWGAFCLSGP